MKHLNNNLVKIFVVVFFIASQFVSDNELQLSKDVIALMCQAIHYAVIVMKYPKVKILSITPVLSSSAISDSPSSSVSIQLFQPVDSDLTKSNDSE